MAQLGSYAQALGQMASDAAVGGLKGFAQGAKYAAMREMPALTMGMAFAKDVRSRASKIQDNKTAAAEERQARATENLVDQQAKNNVISLDMARQLRQMNQSIRAQTSLLGVQVQEQKRQAQFAEEAEREAKNQQDKLLEALKKLGGGGAGGGTSLGGTTGGAADQGGIFDSILGWLGNAALGYLGIKGAGGLLRRGVGGAAGRGLGMLGAAGAGLLGANRLRGMFGRGGAPGARPSNVIPFPGGRTGAANDAMFKRPGFWSRLGSRAASKVGVGSLAKRAIPWAGWGLLAYDAYDILDYAFTGGAEAAMGGPGGPGGGGGQFSPFGPLGLLYASTLYKKNKKTTRRPPLRVQANTPVAPRNIELGAGAGRALPGSTTRPYGSGRTGSTGGQQPSTGTPPDTGFAPPQGVSRNITDQIIQVESGGRNIANLDGTTSAFGIAQITKGTFEGLVAQSRPGDPLYGKTFEDMKGSVALQRAALSKLTEGNIRSMRRRNIQVDDVAVYLAHFLGQAGAIRVLQAPDDTPIADVVSARQIAANRRVFANIRNVGDLKAWAKRKLDDAKTRVGTTSQSGAVAAATSSTTAPGTGGVTVAQQTEIVQALGKAWVSAYNNPTMGEEQKDVVRRTYEEQAAKLRSMTETPAVTTTGTDTTQTLPTVTVTGQRFRGRGYRDPLTLRGAPEYQAPVTVTTRTPSGTAVTRPDEPVPVHDAEANERLANIEKGQNAVRKETTGLSQNTALASRLYARRVRSTRRILTPEEQADEYLKKAQQGFLNAFDRTLTKALKDFGTNFLKSTGYAPGGTPVTAQEAMRVGYAGQQVGKMLDLDKKVASALEKVIGKEYSRMLAPAVSQLGKAYINSMAIGIGQSLFGKIGGFGPKTSQAITGQILGNLAKGNKQIAMEQLLYGLTGIATGPETIAQSYGFRSAAEGIGYMAEVFAAKSTNWIRGAFGWEDRTTAQQVRDPVTGRLYTPDGVGEANAMDNIAMGGYGGIFRREAAQTLRTSQMTTMVGKSNNILTEGAATLNGILLVSVTNAGDFASDDEKFKQQMLGGLTSFATMGLKNVMDGGPGGFSTVFNPSARGGPSWAGTPGFNPAAQRQGTIDYSLVPSNQQGMVGSAVADDISGTYQYSKANFDLYQQGIKLNANAIGDSATQNVSVTNAADRNNQVGMQQQTAEITGELRNLQGRMGGGGGGTGIPGFTTNNPFYDFAISMGTSFVTNKLTQGIKNPYVRSIANFGLNYAAQKYVLPTIFGGAGGAAAGGAAAGGAGAGGLFAGLGGLGAGGLIGGIGSFVGGGLTNLAMATGSNLFGTLGASLQYGLNPFGQQAIMLGQQAAGMSSLAGSTFSQALPYAASIVQLLQGNIKGAATTAALTYIGTAIGGPVGGFIGSVIGSVFGKKKKAPPPKIIEKVIVMADRDISKKATVREENGPTDGQKQLADAFLNTAFNTAFSIYQVSKINPPFNAIYIAIRNNNLKMALPSNYSGGTVNDGWVIDENMDSKKNSQYYMLQIMRKIKEVYTAGSQDPEYLKKIEEGYKIVANKTAGQLAGGLISNLQYGKYALTGDQTSRYGTTTKGAVQSYVLGQESGRTVYPGLTVTTSTSDTTAGSITPAGSSGTAVTITPTTGGGGDGTGTTQNVSVVTDNSKTTNEGSTVNTTYLNTTGGGDMYGRAGMNTSMSLTV